MTKSQVYCFLRYKCLCVFLCSLYTATVLSGSGRNLALLYPPDGHGSWGLTSDA